MDLHNATEFYEKCGKTDKRSPKEWVKLSGTKSIIEDLDHGEITGEDGEYYFDDRLLFHYQLYLNPEKATDYSLGKQEPHWCDEIKNELEEKIGSGLFRIVFQKALERVTGLTYVDFSRKYGIHDVWKCLSHEGRDVLGSFFSIVLVSCKAHNRKIDTYYLDSLFNIYNDALSKHLLLSRTKTIATTEKGELYINRKNFIAWRSKDVG